MTARLDPSIILLPYLPLHRAVSIGTWELLPYRDIPDADGPNGRTFARRLMGAYRTPAMEGAILRRRGELVVAPTTADFDRLRWSITFAALDANPPRDRGEWCTTENASFYAHAHGTGEFTAVLEGVLATTLRGFSFGERAKIAAPAALARPSRVDLDAALMGAVYRGGAMIGARSNA